MGSWIKWLLWQGWNFFTGSATYFHLPRPTWLWPLLSAQFASSRDQHRAPFPKGISQLLVVSWLHWITSVMKGQVFALTGIDAYSGYRLTSPACNTSTKTIICGFRETSLTVMVFHATTLFLTKEITYSKRSVAMSPWSWKSLALSSFPPSWSCWLDRTVEWPFEDSLHCQLDAKLCKAGARLSRRLCMLWIGLQYMVLFL